MIRLANPLSSGQMNILHALAPGAYGGLERVVQALACGHRSLGHRVSVAAVHQPGDPIESFLSALEAGGVRVVPVGVSGRKYSTERAMVEQACNKLRPDVLHTHGYRPDVLLAGVARGLGLPHVSTVHGFTGGDWKNRCYEFLQKRSYRRMSAVVAVSTRIAEILAAAGVPRERVHVIRNAWGGTSAPLPRDAARAALRLPAHGYTVGWVGRLSREKGPDVMLEALRPLMDLPISFSFIGDGPQLERLRVRSRALGLDGRVRFHGAIPDAGRFAGAFDLFALSSRTEGTPIALFEAVAAGVPVVATEVGGVPEILSAGEGLLVPPEDPAALAAAIRQAHGDPAGALQRAAAAEQRMGRDCALPQWLDRYLTLYEQISSPARRADPCQV